jgi:hypothetical protein
MANDDLHPSYLELDRARLGVASPSTEEHLRRCTRCADHVKAVQVQLPVPSWVHQEATRAGRATLQAPWRWIGVAATAVMVGLLVILAVKGVDVTPPPPSEVNPQIALKEANPSVAVYVKRGERVMLWSGDVPLETGDRIRLQVAPGKYSHIVVSTADASGADKVLYEGDLETKDPAFLPVSFRLEGPQSSESLEITLSSRAGGGDAGNRGRDVWTKKLVLPKHGGF